MIRIFFSKEAGNYAINDFVFGNSKSIWNLSEVKEVGLKPDVSKQQLSVSLKVLVRIPLGAGG